MIDLDELTSFSKDKGFIFTSSHIYGGFSGVYDYGPIGVLLKNNIKQMWWENMVKIREDIVGLDSGIVMNPKVWIASGHTTGFSDVSVYCKKTKKKFRLDHLLSDAGIDTKGKENIEELKEIFNKNKDKLKIPNIDVNNLSDPVSENLLATTNLGLHSVISPNSDTSSPQEKVYLRGETCQGIYVNFKQVLDSMHMKLPFGIAQIGKAFRNEISPRQFLFRTREFEQMEMQYFCTKEDTDKYFKDFLESELSFLTSIGIKKENIRTKPHEDLVFYANKASDIEYKYPFGWGELEGIHDRGIYDLSQHEEYSKQKLRYFDQDTNSHIIPNIIETSIGVGRLFLALLHSAYDREEIESKDGKEKEKSRVVLRFKYNIAPIKLAILPLMKKDELKEKAREIFNSLSKNFYSTYDEVGTIGKRYRRQDEIGTPFCITIDYDSLEDNKITIRQRDTMKQERIDIDKIEEYIENNKDF